MSEYICQRCLKDFKQKSRYEKHLARKTPCKDNRDKSQEIINEVVEDIVKKIDSKKNYKFKYIDLFCGIGGFHQVLKRLGGECILACDKDKYCREVYKNNYGINVEEDVKKLNVDTINDFDILCGGFPCQSFSQAGNKKTFDDERGLLFDEIIRIAKTKKPKIMFLENVKHILKVGDGKVIKYILEQLDKTGYNVQYFKMSPHEYGIPQQRDRIYFICIRKDIYKQPIELKYSKIETIKFNDFLDNPKDIDDKYLVKGDVLKTLEAWDEMIKVFEVGEKISPVILVNEFYKTYTDSEFKNLAKWRQDYITKNRPLYKKYKTQFDAWYIKHKDIISKREIYSKLEWQAGIVKENDSIFNYFIQIRQSGIRVKKAVYFPTLVAMSQIPIYGKQKRYITPIECLRLQSFPCDFKLLEDDKHSYKQLGNSVNVNNVANVVESTLDEYVFNKNESI